MGGRKLSIVEASSYLAENPVAEAPKIWIIKSSSNGWGHFWGKRGAWTELIYEAQRFTNWVVAKTMLDTLGAYDDDPPEAFPLPPYTMEFFSYDHLPEGVVRETSRRVENLAFALVNTHFKEPLSPGSSEQLRLGLQRLVEAKDCFVRAALGLTPVRRSQVSPLSEEDPS